MEPSSVLASGQEIIYPFNGPFPEVNLLRWRLEEGDTLDELHQRFRIPMEALYVAEEEALGHRDQRALEVGTRLEIRAESEVDLPFQIKVEYQDEWLTDYDAQVLESLMKQVFAAAEYTFGDLSFMAEATSGEMRFIRHDGWGFFPDSRRYLICIPYNDLHNGLLEEESRVRGKLAHEVFHSLPFPSWSAASEEGGAEYFGRMVATNGFDSQFMAYARRRYDESNQPELREMVFGTGAIRVESELAALAWEKIADQYPGILEYLMQQSVKWHRDNKEDWQASVPVEIITGWFKEFSPGAWDFVQEQHILFTQNQS